MATTRATAREISARDPGLEPQPAEQDEQGEQRDGGAQRAERPASRRRVAGPAGTWRQLRVVGWAVPAAAPSGSGSSTLAGAPWIEASSTSIGVGHAHRVAGALDRRGDLHQAPRVGGDQHLGAGGDDVVGLAVPELARRLGVEDVVDAGRAAAQLGLGDLVQLAGPGWRRAGGAAGPARPGRGPGGRRRGRRRRARAGAARRPGRARRGSPRRRAPCPANRAARSAYAGSSASSSAYSFIVEPQPAAFTTTCSTPAASKASTSAPGEGLGLGLAAVVHRQRPAAALRGRARRRRSPRRAAPGRWRR